MSVYEMLILQGKSEEEAKEVGGKIFTFGSYRLGVHGKGKLCTSLYDYGMAIGYSNLYNYSKAW